MTSKKYYTQQELDYMIKDNIGKNAQDALIKIKNSQIKNSKITKYQYV